MPPRKNMLAFKKEKLKFEELKIDEQLKAAGLFEDGLTFEQKCEYINLLSASKQIAMKEEKERLERDIDKSNQHAEQRADQSNNYIDNDDKVDDAGVDKVDTTSMGQSCSSARSSLVSSSPSVVDVKGIHDANSNIINDNCKSDDLTNVSDYNSEEIINNCDFHNETSENIDNSSSEEMLKISNNLNNSNIADRSSLGHDMNIKNKENFGSEEYLVSKSDDDHDSSMKLASSCKVKNGSINPSLISSQDIFDITECDEENFFDAHDRSNSDKLCTSDNENDTDMAVSQDSEDIKSSSSPIITTIKAKMTSLKGEEYNRIYQLLCNWHTQEYSKQRNLSFGAKWGPPLTVCTNLVNGLDRPKRQPKFKKVKPEPPPPLPSDSDSDFSEIEHHIDNDHDWENKSKKPIRKRGRPTIKRGKASPAKLSENVSTTMKTSVSHMQKVGDVDDEIFLSEGFSKKVQLNDDKPISGTVQAEIHREDSSIEELPDLIVRKDRVNGLPGLCKLGRITPVKRTARKSFQLGPRTCKIIKSQSNSKDKTVLTGHPSVIIETDEENSPTLSQDVENNYKRSLDDNSELVIVKKRKPIHDIAAHEQSSSRKEFHNSSLKNGTNLNTVVEIDSEETAESLSFQSRLEGVAIRHGLGTSSLLGRLLKKDGKELTVTTTLKTTNTRKTEVIVGSDEEEKMLPEVQCPLCQSYFKPVEIETHASDCNGLSDSSQGNEIFPPIDFKSSIRTNDTRRSYRNKKTEESR